VKKAIVALLTVAVLLLLGCFEETVIMMDRTVSATDTHGFLYLADQGLFNADSVTVTDGTITSGTPGDTNAADGVHLVVNETGEFKVDFNMGRLGHPIGSINIVGRYDGSPAHNVKIYAYNYVTGGYVALTGATTDFVSSEEDRKYFFVIPFPHQNFFASGVASIRIEHLSNAVGTNNLYIDFFEVEELTMAFDTIGKWEDVNNMAIGAFNNVTTDENSFTIVDAGNYFVNVDYVVSGAINSVVHSHLFVDDVLIPSVGVRRWINSGGDIGSIGMSGIVPLQPKDQLELKFVSDINGNYITIQHLSWEVIKID